MFQVDCQKEVPNEKLIVVICFKVGNKEGAKKNYFVICELLAEKYKIQERSEEETSILLNTMATYVPRYIVELYGNMGQKMRESISTSSSALSKFFRSSGLHDNSPSRENVPTEPTTKKFEAAILFIDISGFTALNERLGQLGPKGPEQVSKHLNCYFGQLIEEVNRHGGGLLGCILFFFLKFLRNSGNKRCAQVCR